MNRLQIFGSSGFIGSHLMKFFSESGVYDVTGYSSNDCDLFSGSQTKKALRIAEKDTCVILAAAVTRLVDTSTDVIYNNLRMIENICSGLGEYPVQHVLFLSTVDVYGLTENHVPISEKTPCKPCDNYAISKLACEHYLKKELREMGIPLTIFRLPGVYGDRDEGKSTVSALVQSAFRDGLVMIDGDGSDLRDFIYARDLGAVMSAAFTDRIEGTFNLVTGDSLSIHDAARYIQKEMNGRCRLVFKEKTDQNSERVKDLVFDNRHFINHFPDLVLTTIQDGIKTYIKTYKEKEHESSSIV